MSKPIDTLGLYAKFGAQQQTSLHDPTTRAAFASHVEAAMERAIHDQRLLQGHRVEAMFRALVESLGEVLLIKPEDGGPFHAKSPMLAPDFRVVLPDLEQWVVEVKNVHEEDPFAQRRDLMRPDYLARLQAYAEATGAKLKLAIYWSRWALWTLVSPEQFVNAEGVVDVEMGAAMMANELGRLGDRSVHTTGPFRLRFVVDPEKTTPIDDEGNVVATFSGTQLYRADVLLEDPEDVAAAWVLIEHGEWESLEPEYVVEEDRFIAVDFLWQPRQASQDGVDHIGTLSRIYARFYARQTVKDGAVVQLLAPPRPEWFRRFIDQPNRSPALPLWIIEQRPNPAARARDAA